MVAKLLATSAVTDLIGDRIWPAGVPQDTGRTTSITYAPMGRRFQNIAGPTGGNGSAELDIQVDCWASSYAAAQGLADVVRDALNAWSDTDGTPSVTKCHHQDEIYLPEPREGGQDEYTHRVSQDYMLQYLDT